MTKQIISAIKVSALALALSFGLSFVYAWTAPTQNPPAGNVSAPINTSATAQTKAGGLTVGGLTLPAGSTITGGGANSTYGSLTVNGSKNGWYGLNFPGAGTLMMHPSYSGFYNSSDSNWRWYVTDVGVSNQSGNANAADFCTSGGKCLSAAGGGLGVGQTYQNMVGSAVGCASVRAANVLCTNSTGKPIFVMVTYSLPHTNLMGFFVDGVQVGTSFNDDYGSVAQHVNSTISAIVPNGSTYKVSSYTPTTWFELR